MPEPNRLQYLLELFKTGRITWEDHAELFRLIAKDDELKKYMQSADDAPIHPKAYETDWLSVYDEISKKLHPHPTASSDKNIIKLPLFRKKWLQYAAAIFLALGIATYFFTLKKPADSATATKIPDIKPGSDRAILTLSDGRMVELNDSSQRQIADGYIQINQTNGILNYSSKPAHYSTSETISFNTMTTPRGGQYQLVLPDGSKVWLNSASSLKYPVIFSGKERRVSLEGEAYFEIKDNKDQPFHVQYGQNDIKVLGTSFNVNAYSNEPSTKATLLQGSVSLSTNIKEDVVLKPGQQAEITGSKDLKISSDIDINQVIAWQKGIFEFTSADLETISRQLSRWYDVDIITQKGKTDLKFSGGITKRTPLAKVLEVLEANGIKHNWKNNTLKLYTN